MKGAVLAKEGAIPTYTDFPDPIPANDEQVLVTVKAASVTQLDIMKSAGRHYTHYPQFPTVVGLDGIGMLADGTLIHAVGLTGMMAEKALVRKDAWTVLPGGVDLAIAAALPNALMGSGMALTHRAKIKAGQTILINGATGLTGKLAVQLARYYGATRIIASGRNPEGLAMLEQLGTDEVISLKQDNTSFIEQIKKIHLETPIDIIIDYLWGQPVEMILTALQHTHDHPVKLVTVGQMAGADIKLPSAFLRSSPIELLGSGIGSIPSRELAGYMKNTLPEMYRLAADGRLVMEVETAPLKDIENFWRREAGKGMVIQM